MAALPETAGWLGDAGEAGPARGPGYRFGHSPGAGIHAKNYNENDFLFQYIFIRRLWFIQNCLILFSTSTVAAIFLSPPSLFMDTPAWMHAYRDVGVRAASGTSRRGGRAASGTGRRGCPEPPGAGQNPGKQGRDVKRIAISANPHFVIPAKAGIQGGEAKVSG